MENIDFNKGQGLVPAIIQNPITKENLMLGYMNEEALRKTIDDGKVCFYSRSKKRLWTKGETSGNFLLFQSYKIDCDRDSLLIFALPTGPVCHTGKNNCWDTDNNNNNNNNPNFLNELERIITERRLDRSKASYVHSLFQEGINKIAQKLGEEAVELVIEAMDNNDDNFKNEAADLLFHYLILLNAKGFQLNDIIQILSLRNNNR